MDRYTIYCTPEQTKKALELGAPIEELDNEVAIENRSHIGFGLPAYGSFDDYLNKEEYPDVTIIEVDDVRYAYMIPTAEQMIGWLEEQGFDINTSSFCAVVDYEHVGTLGIYSGSRKESTNTAIDAALEYLIRNKK